MIDQDVKGERAAAKQELTQLLVDILVPPLKTEVSALLEENIYPLERSILERQDRLEVQTGKVTRFINKHYPESSLPLEEQLQTLEFAQQEANELAQSRNLQLLEILGQYSQQSQDIQTGVAGLSAQIGGVGEHQVALQAQAQRVGDASLQSVAQLTQNLASFAQWHQQAHTQAVDAVQAMGAAADSKLEQYQQQQQSQWQAISHQTISIQTELEELAHGLETAEGRRVNAEDQLQHWVQTNQEDVSQLAQQLASLISAQQQGQAELHETMCMLGEAAADKLEGQQQRLASLFMAQQQAQIELHATIRTLSEVTAGKLDAHQQQMQKHWLTVHGSAQQRLGRSLGSLLEQLRKLDKESVSRLEKLTMLTAGHLRSAVHKEVSALGQQLQDLWLTQANNLHERLGEQHQALSAAHAQHQMYQAQALALKAQVVNGQKHIKWVAYGCAALAAANLGGLLYLVLGS